MLPADITLEQALGLLALPRVLGNHPETGTPVQAGIGRFGPYVRHGTLMASLPKKLRDENRDPTLEEAVELLAAKAGKTGKAPKEAKTKAGTSARKTGAKKTTTKKAAKK